MNKAYMKWLKDSHKNICIFLLVMEIILGFLPVVTEGFHHIGTATYNTSIAMITIASIAAAVILPMFFFRYIHKKNSVDLYFSLPVSRKEQLITTVVFLLITVSGSFLISTLLVWIFCHTDHNFFWQWILMQPWMIYGTLTVILITVCVYALANNIFDGFVMVCAYAALPMVIDMAYESFIGNLVAGHPYSSSLDFWEYFSPLWMTGHNIAGISTISEFIFRFSFIPVLAIYILVACFGLNRNFIHRQSERAEQTSDSFLTYPFIGNAYLFLLLLSSVFTSYSSTAEPVDVIFCFLLFLCYIIASFVYHRSMKFHWTYLLGYGIALGLSFLIASAGWNSHGFGLADRYRLYTEKYLVYDYTMSCDPEDLGKFDDTSDISVDVTMEIPVSQKDQYADEIRIMENLRKKEIRKYYRDRNNLTSIGNLNVYNTRQSIYNNNVQSFNDWSYGIYDPLSEEQLKQLDKKGKVEIYDSQTGKTVSLSEYLSDRKK